MCLTKNHTILALTCTRWYQKTADVRFFPFIQKLYVQFQNVLNILHLSLILMCGKNLIPINQAYIKVKQFLKKNKKTQYFLWSSKKFVECAFLWDYLNDRVYKNKPQTLHDLKQSVRLEAMGIAGNALANFKHWVRATEYLIFQSKIF